MFHQIPDAKAITRASNGVYRQADLYHYKGRIYVKHGSGYAWILKTGLKNSPIQTSVESVNIDELELPFEETFDKRGYLVLPEGFKSE